jgi:SnoaL-like protein
MTVREGLSLQSHAMTVGELLELAALQRLAWTYCHAVDRRDYVLLRSLYHDDAIDDHGAMFCGTPDEYVAWLPTMMARWQATSHAIANSLFLIEGDHAEGELLTTAYHRSLEGTQELIAHGRYLDRYEKRAGVWKFLRRSLVLDWVSERSVAAPIETVGSGLGVPLGQASAADPCYGRLPMFKRQRRG